MLTDFTARMADGRTSDYRPNCVMNHELSKGKSHFEYRYYLENNDSN